MAEKKASKLKGIVPAKIEKRLKLYMYGPAGVGKTIAALQFPNAYVIDTERGTENYGQTLEKAGSVVFQSNDYFEIRQEIETLLTEEHSFKTLIIDPMTVVYQSIQDLWTRRFENEAREKSKGQYSDMQDFGMRYWGKVKADYKALQRIIMRLDMNVICTSHQKDVYGTGFSKVGVTFDSMRGDDYFFDQVFRLEKQGKDRVAITEKERAEIGCNKFPEEFVWSYANFLKFYGGEALERKAEVVKMATKDQVKELKDLLDVVKLPDGLVDKWLAKADADDWNEMTEGQIIKCIEYCKKRTSDIQKEE